MLKLHPTPAKVGILGASLETPNLGVGTLATGAVQCVRRAYPQADIAFVDYGTQSHDCVVRSAEGPIPVHLLNLRFSLRWWPANHIAILLGLALLLRVLPAPALRAWVVRRHRCLQKLCAIDLFCSVAGGDSFSDLYGVVRFFYCALPQLLVLALGKPLVLLPQTYGPFRHSFLRRAAQALVRRAQYAWCRDGESLARLMGAAQSDPGEASFGYDLGFAIDSCPAAHLQVEGFALPLRRDPGLVGVNVSGLLYRGGYRGKNQFGLQSSYPRLIRTIIELLLSYPGTRVLLIPHVLGTDAENDGEACEHTYRALCTLYPGRIGVLRGTYGPGEIRAVIGMTDFFVGARMHACIAAVAQGIAAISIAYSDKFAGVMHAVQSEGLVADARVLSQLQILDAVHQAYQRRAATSRALQAQLPRIREQARNVLCTEPCRAEVLQRATLPA